MRADALATAFAEWRKSHKSILPPRRGSGGKQGGLRQLARVSGCGRAERQRNNSPKEKFFRSFISKQRERTESLLWQKSYIRGFSFNFNMTNLDILKLQRERLLFAIQNSSDDYKKKSFFKTFQQVDKRISNIEKEITRKQAQTVLPF
jgi:hypothetical protein